MRNQIIFTVCLLIAWPAVANAEEPASDLAQHDVHWSYEGDTGPAHWGELSPEFKKCKSGWMQSPINVTQVHPAGFSLIQFNYEPTPLSVENNGHTIKVNYSGESHIMIDGERHKLVQFHFHSPSENAANGEPFDLVAHLVHANDAGGLAVVAVMFSQGAENAALKKIWRDMPASAGESVEKRDDINAADLLPDDHTYYHFMGSLTTPPCTEGVRWYVLERPVSVGEKQLAEFRKLYHGNVRPVQRLNGRSVRSSRPVPGAPEAAKPAPASRFRVPGMK